MVHGGQGLFLGLEQVLCDFIFESLMMGNDLNGDF